MKKVNLIGITGSGESTAVSCGKFVLAAMRGESGEVLSEVMIDDNDLSETTWSEMIAYLSRRGVDVSYDHDLAYPVARSQSK